MVDGDGEGYVYGDMVASRSCEEIDCVLRACSWFIGLLRFDDDAALTAPDAGVTVIATEVLTAGQGVSGAVAAFETEYEVGGLGVPF